MSPVFISVIFLLLIHLFSFDWLWGWSTHLTLHRHPTSEERERERDKHRHQGIKRQTDKLIGFWRETETIIHFLDVNCFNDEHFVRTEGVEVKEWRREGKRTHTRCKTSPRKKRSKLFLLSSAAVFWLLSCLFFLVLFVCCLRETVVPLFFLIKKIHNEMKPRCKLHRSCRWRRRRRRGRRMQERDTSWSLYSCLTRRRRRERRVAVRGERDWLLSKPASLALKGKGMQNMAASKSKHERWWWKKSQGKMLFASSSSFHSSPCSTHRQSKEKSRLKWRAKQMNESVDVQIMLMIIMNE